MEIASIWLNNDKKKSTPLNSLFSVWYAEWESTFTFYQSYSPREKNLANKPTHARKHSMSTAFPWLLYNRRTITAKVEVCGTLLLTKPKAKTVKLLCCTQLAHTISHSVRMFCTLHERRSMATYLPRSPELEALEENSFY